MRLKQRSTVDLPQPDGPMNAVISLRRIVEVHVAHGAEPAVVDGEVVDLEHDLALALGERSSARRAGCWRVRISVVMVGPSSDLPVEAAGPLVSVSWRVRPAVPTSVTTVSPVGCQRPAGEAYGASVDHRRGSR